LITRASSSKLRGLGNIKLRSPSAEINRLGGTEIILLRGAKKIGEANQERNLNKRRFREKEAGAEMPSTIIPKTSRSLLTSEPYSEVSKEEEKREHTGRPTLGNRNSGRS
jgi:hypothetical protein